MQKMSLFLYQGMASAMPNRAQNQVGFSPRGPISAPSHDHQLQRAELSRRRKAPIRSVEMTHRAQRARAGGAVQISPALTGW
jgi:hypothetical protein